MGLDIIKFLTGFVLTGLVAFFIEKKEVLTLGGLVAAIFLGSVVYGLGGPVWLGVMMAFFVSSSAFSSYKKEAKEKVNREQFDKAGPRDMWQVLANGGLSALMAAAFFINPSPVFFAAFLGIIASVNADTWATEIGVFSRKPPRLITTLKSVEKGSSGGVTVLGFVVSLAGGAFIGLSAMAFLGLFPSPLLAMPLLKLFAICVSGGFLGSVFDSFLGASIQAQHYCPSCRKMTEQRFSHHCGTKTIPRTGLSFVDNDAVNLFSSVFGGVVSALVFLAL